MSSADNIILNILSKAGGGVLLFLSSVVMVRYFPKEDYGAFLQIMLIVNTVALLGNFGLPESVYFFFQNTQDRVGFVGRSLLLAIGLAFFWALILYGVKGLFASWFHDPFIKQSGLILSLMASARIISQFREPVLISADKLLLNSWVNIFGEMLFFLPTIIGPLFIDSISVILTLVCLGAVITSVISLFVITFVIKTYKQPVLARDTSDTTFVNVTLLKQFKYSLPIAVASYIGIIGRQIDQYLVSLFFTSSDYAVYSRGALRLPVIANLQLFVNDLKMPQYVRHFRSGTKASFLRLYHKSIISVAKLKYPAFFFLFAMAPIIINVLYTSDYLDAVPVFRVYSLLLLTEVTMFGLIPRVSAKTKFITVSVIITILANILVSLLLLPILGALGAAAGTLISSCLGAFYLLLVSCKISGISLLNIFPWKLLAKLMLLSLLPSIPLYLIPHIFSLKSEREGLILILFGGIFYVLTWGLLMIKYRLITIEESEIIRKWLRIDLSRWVH